MFIICIPRFPSRYGFCVGFLFLKEERFEKLNPWKTIKVLAILISYKKFTKMKTSLGFLVILVGKVFLFQGNRFLNRQSIFNFSKFFNFFTNKFCP